MPPELFLKTRKSPVGSGTKRFIASRTAKTAKPSFVEPPQIAEPKSKKERHAEIIFSIIAETLTIEVDDITLNAYLVEDLGADSLDAMEIILKMEDEFNIEVSDDDAGNVRLVSDLCRLVAPGTHPGAAA